MDPATQARPPRPAHLRQQVSAGYELLQQGRSNEADRLAERLLSNFPDDVDSLILASEAKLALDAPEQALELNDRAIAQTSTPFPLLIKKATLLMQTRRKALARQVAQEAEQLARNDPASLAAIARIHEGCNDPLLAARLYERALELAPLDQRPRHLFSLASVRFYTGEIDAAERDLDELIARIPQAGNAMWLRATLRRQTAERNHVQALEDALNARFAQPQERAAAGYALAKELEDLGEHGRAFAALEQAAKIKRTTLDYHVEQECAAIQALGQSFDAPMQPEPGNRGEGAIFIVGMPRSGTTLLESLLVQHTIASSAGELLDFGLLLAGRVNQHMQQKPGTQSVELIQSIDFESLGHEYLRGAREAALDNAVFIDKMPINYIYCGAIVKALPGARIIQLERDPMDTCFAVYKTLFHRAYHFSYRLDELAEYYIAYHRAMQHWKDVLPDRIHAVRYESLVTEPLKHAQTIATQCGLTWNETATPQQAVTSASASQVREPVHTRSIGAWQRHREALAPLRSRLQDAGVIAD